MQFGLLKCRWFPTGKIVFLAPTRPLVDQQKSACISIVGIPERITEEMTGASMPVDERRKAWTSKSVFFCTPQVRMNLLLGLF
jgi:ATP-dependent DNA helicase MPH1